VAVWIRFTMIGAGRQSLWLPAKKYPPGPLRMDRYSESPRPAPEDGDAHRNVWAMPCRHAPFTHVIAMLPWLRAPRRLGIRRHDHFRGSRMDNPSMPLRGDRAYFLDQACREILHAPRQSALSVGPERRAWHKPVQAAEHHARRVLA
jgi:hypothetical protein